MGDYACLLDSHSVELIEGRSPFYSRDDRDFLMQAYDNGELFPCLPQIVRAQVSSRLLNFEDYLLIPSLRTFFEDTKWLEVSHKVLKELVPRSKRTLRSSLRKYFNPPKRGFVSIQTPDGKFEDQSSQSDKRDFQVCYVQLHCIAQREFPSMGELKPRKDNRSSRSAPLIRNKVQCWAELAATALRLGFDTSCIRRLTSGHPATVVARDFLSHARPPHLFCFPDLRLEEESTKIGATLDRVEPLQMTSQQPGYTCDSYQAWDLRRRCGRVFERAFRNDQQFMFARFILDATKPQRKQSVTSFGVTHHIFSMFFGEASDDVSSENSDADSDADSDANSDDDEDCLNSPVTSHSSRMDYSRPSVPITTGEGNLRIHNDANLTSNTRSNASLLPNPPATNLANVTKDIMAPLPDPSIVDHMQPSELSASEPTSQNHPLQQPPDAEQHAQKDVGRLEQQDALFEYDEDTDMSDGAHAAQEVQHAPAEATRKARAETEARVDLEAATAEATRIKIIAETRLTTMAGELARAKEKAVEAEARAVETVERAAREQAAATEWAAKQAAVERAAREQAAATERAALERAAAERDAAERAAREQAVVAEQAAREQAVATERAAKQAAVERAAREQAAVVERAAAARAAAKERARIAEEKRQQESKELIETFGTYNKHHTIFPGAVANLAGTQLATSSDMAELTQPAMPSFYTGEIPANLASGQQRKGRVEKVTVMDPKIYENEPLMINRKRKFPRPMNFVKEDEHLLQVQFADSIVRMPDARLKLGRGIYQSLVQVIEDKLTYSLISESSTHERNLLQLIEQHSKKEQAWVAVYNKHASILQTIPMRRQDICVPGQTLILGDGDFDSGLLRKHELVRRPIMTADYIEPDETGLDKRRPEISWRDGNWAIVNKKDPGNASKRPMLKKAPDQVGTDLGGNELNEGSASNETEEEEW
jgi:hypothetical protein